MTYVHSLPCRTSLLYPRKCLTIKWEYSQGLESQKRCVGKTGPADQKPRASKRNNRCYDSNGRASKQGDHDPRELHTLSAIRGSHTWCTGRCRRQLPSSLRNVDPLPDKSAVHRLLSANGTVWISVMHNISPVTDTGERQPTPFQQNTRLSEYLSMHEHLRRAVYSLRSRQLALVRRW